MRINNSVITMFIYGIWRLLDIIDEAKIKINIGIRNIASIVEDTVITILRATLPIERYVHKFDVVPPGVQPTRINPSAISFGKANSFTILKAIIGIKKIEKSCQ